MPRLRNLNLLQDGSYFSWHLHRVPDSRRSRGTSSSVSTRRCANRTSGLERQVFPRLCGARHHRARNSSDFRLTELPFLIPVQQRFGNSATPGDTTYVSWFRLARIYYTPLSLVYASALWRRRGCGSDSTSPLSIRSPASRKASLCNSPSSHKGDIAVCVWFQGVHVRILGFFPDSKPTEMERRLLILNNKC